MRFNPTLPSGMVSKSPQVHIDALEGYQQLLLELWTEIENGAGDVELPDWESYLREYVEADRAELAAE